ncbi:sodium-dependent bicarbonate transport family permease [Romeria aff. gracilis LEGE 07310]|uniref:Sodium-dependent bicarbonate transport family permease n=1 Tax=Vasconcelosia minhoensis LEGE 07310 TaxID=915328 RepID=A0A8J7A9A8_9CYAN|nr:sodium-dependent bicarbonate transport family permease [Romeria gracilis]MBE9078490.1 sodium-dependent bicarbonate transport family permease [Romeria aff. gracilis LEGE 07310]
MDFLADFLTKFGSQLQSPTLGFLLGGIVVAALGSRLAIPDAIYKFIVFMLLIKVGLSGGIAIRNANIAEMLLPALFAVITGILIVFIASVTLAKMPGIRTVDALATGGLFGAVSGSTLAAGITVMEGQGIEYEAWAGALYPFMDIPALVTAIVLASIYTRKRKRDKYLKNEAYLKKEAVASGGYASEPGGSTGGYASEPGGSADDRVKIWPIIKDSLQGSALSALLIGLALGLLTRPESVFESFYEPLFRGLLSILMLVMGMEAWARLGELRKVAQWYAVYALVAPLLHGFIAFGLGYIAHITTGFSPGGVALLAIIAASSSDISGPPTLRGGIPSANPSAYIGSSTAIGTPIAIAIGIPLFIGLAQTLGG